MKADTVGQPCASASRLHGGAIMAFADMMGATGAGFNLPDGAGTTTVESKTNFIGPAPEGTTVTAKSLPSISAGARRSGHPITGENGKLVAVVTQTQFVLEPLPSAKQPV